MHLTTNTHEHWKCSFAFKKKDNIVVGATLASGVGSVFITTGSAATDMAENAAVPIASDMALVDRIPLLPPCARRLNASALEEHAGDQGNVGVPSGITP